MKKIISIIATLIMCMTLSSCLTTTAAEYDGYYYGNKVDVNILVTYGKPFYNAEGLLLYYLYNNMYYYPYYTGGVYYFYRYHKPLPMDRLRWHRPIPRDFYRKSPTHVHQYNRPSVQPRPNVNTRPRVQPRPNNNTHMDRNRPNVNNRSTNSNGMHRNSNVQPRSRGGRR